MPCPHRPRGLSLGGSNPPGCTYIGYPPIRRSVAAHKYRLHPVSDPACRRAEFEDLPTPRARDRRRAPRDPANCVGLVSGKLISVAFFTRMSGQHLRFPLAFHRVCVGNDKRPSNLRSEACDGLEHLRTMTVALGPSSLIVGSTNSTACMFSTITAQTSDAIFPPSSPIQTWTSAPAIPMPVPAPSSLSLVCLAGLLMLAGAWKLSTPVENSQNRRSKIPRPRQGGG